MAFRTRLLAVAVCAAGALPAMASAKDSCEWQSPASDPYTGDVPGAVDRYAGIPNATRERLKARMARFAYDDIVAIRRDSIEGNFAYEPALLDMHFGKRRICGEVTRKTWKPDHEERGLAYCEDGHCVVVPLVCRNVSRIIRKPTGGIATRGGGGAPGQPAEPPLVFEPPAAGMPPGTTPPPEAEPVTRTPLSLVPPTPDTPGTALPPALPAPVPALPQPDPAAPPFPSMPPLPHLPPAIPAVPEPASLLLWATGLAALGLWRRRATR